MWDAVLQDSGGREQVTATGKRARRKFGNRYAAKAGKQRRRARKRFGELKYSALRKTAEAAVRLEPICDPGRPWSDCATRVRRVVEERAPEGRGVKS